MFTRLLLFLGVVSLFPGAVALATEPQLTLEAVVAVVQEQNPEIRAAREAVEAGRARLPQATALDDPEAKVELFNYRENFDSDGASNTIFGLSQRFPYPGKRALRSRVVEEEIRKAEAMVRAVERDVIGRVKTAYADLALVQRAIELHHEQVRLLRELREAASIRYRAGQGGQVEVLQTMVELSRLQAELPGLEQSRTTARATLATLMDRPVDSFQETPQPLVLPTVAFSLADLEARGLAHRPVLKALEAEKARTNAARALAQRNVYPDFGVQVSRFQNFGARDGFGAMATVTIPFAFWSKPKYDAAAREAEAAGRAAAAQIRDEENKLRLEMQDLYAKLQAARAEAAIYGETALVQAKQTHEAALAGYRSGRASVQTILETRRAVRDIELKLSKAIADAHRFVAELERAVGADLQTLSP